MIQRMERFHDDQTPRTETSVDDPTSLDDSRITPKATPMGSSEEKRKRGSLYARLKRKMYRKAL